MANETDTRASDAVAWLSGVATTMPRGGIDDDKERIDGAIRAELGRAARKKTLRWRLPAA